MQAIESTTEPEGPEHGARSAVDPLKNVARICLVFFALAFIGFFGSVLWQLHQRADPTWAVPNDLSVFWAAAKLALAGAPARAFDLHALTAARHLAPDLPPFDLRMSWTYPPQFLVLVLPLGLMPYATAWLVWAVAGVAAFWLAMRRLVGDPSIVAVTCASPAVLMCAIQGQNSLIVGALLAGLMVTLRSGRATAAGVLLGALTIKPQFGPLLPLALAAARAWRAIGVAVAVTAAIVALTLAWAGPGYWVAFLHALSLTAERMAAAWLPRHLMISWYAFALAAGSSQHAALALQLAVMALLAGAVGWAWLGARVPLELKGAVLAVAVPLFSPYVYFYDLVLPLIGVALVLAGGYVRRTRPGNALGVTAGLVWAAPTLGHFAREAGMAYAFSLLTPPILTAFLVLVLREVALARADAAG